jgi:hypothetical protein
MFQGAVRCFFRKRLRLYLQQSVQSLVSQADNVSLTNVGRLVCRYRVLGLNFMKDGGVCQDVRQSVVNGFVVILRLGIVVVSNVLGHARFSQAEPAVPVSSG